MSAMQNLNKLQEALRTIRDECKGHGNSCGCCPLSIGPYKCGITGQITSGAGDYRVKPQYWNIPEVQLLHPPKEM